MQLRPGSDGHTITPVKGSTRQMDGTPANLNLPSNYPVEALCLICSKPIRCERWFLCGWVHVARFTMAGVA